MAKTKKTTRVLLRYAGQSHDRIAWPGYYDEADRRKLKRLGKIRKCGDCGARPGELHVPGCDLERCADCGGQVITCACQSADMCKSKHGQCA